MTIRKGEPWGQPYLGTTALPSASSDAALARLLAHGRPGGARLGQGPEATNRITPAIALTGGALWAMLGSPKRQGAARFATPIDMGVLTANLEGSERCWYFVNDLVFRSRSWCCGMAFMNGKMVGRLNLGHKAHPNDGQLDRVTWQLRVSELLQVRSRAVLGSFAPHPRIQQDRRRSFQFASIPANALLVSADGIVIMKPAEASLLSEIRVDLITDAGIVVA